MARTLLALAVVGIVVCRSAGDAQRGPDPNLEPLDPTGRISYFIADEIPHSGYRPGDDQLAVWALQEWERASHGAIHFERTLEEADSLLRVFFLVPGATKLGTSQRFMSMRRVRAMVTVETNLERLAEPLGALVTKDPLLRDTIIYLTCLHEVGHALGLPHTSSRDDVMGEGEVANNQARFQRYRRALKTRAAIPTARWLSPRDVAGLNSLYSR
jgi:predicted Zn-dependent protease